MSQLTACKKCGCLIGVAYAEETGGLCVGCTGGTMKHCAKCGRPMVWTDGPTGPCLNCDRFGPGKIKFEHVVPESWRWETNSGNTMLLQHMNVQHLVFAMRMVWNRYFCIKYKGHAGFTEVEVGGYWSMQHRGHDAMVVAMNMFVLEIQRRGGPDEHEAMYHAVLGRMAKVGMLASSLLTPLCLPDLLKKMLLEDHQRIFENPPLRRQKEGFTPLLPEQPVLIMNSPYKLSVDEIRDLSCESNQEAEARFKRYVAGMFSEQSAVLGKLEPLRDYWAQPHEWKVKLNYIEFMKTIVDGESKEYKEIGKEFFMSKKVYVIEARVSDASDGYNAQLSWFSAQKLEKDDKVVVELRDGYAVAVVVNPDSEGKKATKWVVQKLDFTDLGATKAAIAETKKLRKLLDDKLEAQRNLVVYESLAASDPDAAVALARIKELES